MSIGNHMKPNRSGKTKSILPISTMHNFSHRVKMLVFLPFEVPGGS